MSKKFYHKLVDTKAIHREFKSMNMSPEEEKLLHDMLEETIHHKVVHIILSELDPVDRKLFMRQLALGDDKHLWYILNRKTNGIEKKIIDASNEVVHEMHKDIRDARKLN